MPCNVVCRVLLEREGTTQHLKIIAILGYSCKTDVELIALQS